MIAYGSTDFHNKLDMIINFTQDYSVLYNKYDIIEILDIGQISMSWERMCSDMLQEPETLYKLMTLYMLDRVNFPLTNSQLSEFFLDKEYTTYMTLQLVLNDLVEAGLINSHKVGNSTHYEISSDGREALNFFIGDISAAAMADMDEYLENNKYSIRSAVDTTADYFRSGGSYTVHCVSREGSGPLLSIDISVPDERIAADMCANWPARSQELYSHIMLSLMGSDKT